MFSQFGAFDSIILNDLRSLWAGVALFQKNGYQNDNGTVINFQISLDAQGLYSVHLLPAGTRVCVRWFQRKSISLEVIITSLIRERKTEI